MGVIKSFEPPRDDHDVREILFQLLHSGLGDLAWVLDNGERGCEIQWSDDVTDMVSHGTVVYMSSEEHRIYEKRYRDRIRAEVRAEEEARDEAHEARAKPPAPGPDDD